MWRRVNLVLNSFMVGILFEFTYRVEVSVYPIIIGILLVISIILDFWFYNIDGKKDELISEININVDKIIDKSKKDLITVPKPWMVHDAGQDPLHMLWYVQLVHFDDIANGVKEPRQVYVEEVDSFEEALSIAISRINVVGMKKV
jgi:hypothetical protein